MSIPVELHALERAIAELGPDALLVTLSPYSTPHVVSVVASWSNGRLVMSGGRRTRSNLSTRPHVTVIWPALHDRAYRLIVDGIATELPDEHVVVDPTAAVFHRVAAIASDEPNCRPVTDQ